MTQKEFNNDMDKAVCFIAGVLFVLVIEMLVGAV